VTSLTFEITVNFMTENQIGITFRFIGLFNLVIFGRTLRCMTDKAILGGLVSVNIMTFLTLFHGCRQTVAVIIGFVATVTGRFLFLNVKTVTEFKAHGTVFAGSKKQCSES